MFVVLPFRLRLIVIEVNMGMGTIVLWLFKLKSIKINYVITFLRSNIIFSNKFNSCVYTLYLKFQQLLRICYMLEVKQ